ncbi:hypothetical protein Terro_1109 [Terriglobus roseus DSM 18391]|uniref:Uncharacterized protein n=1 Tax=Terriglobus roseus (strain DSM 18391 / NRRL B-41598 / KBS 63) TaxID=926566 RepID=I3ZDW1_TERRK|nr:hypothetical protein [Terriglobus roseus]AFL87429.1 hypothetical protein Terro_1109 [Terriglobus roseus DSM 18391]
MIDPNFQNISDEQELEAPATLRKWAAPVAIVSNVVDVTKSGTVNTPYDGSTGSTIYAS